MITIGWFGRRCILWWMSRLRSISSIRGVAPVAAKAAQYGRNAGASAAHVSPPARQTAIADSRISKPAKSGSDSWNMATPLVHRQRREHGARYQSCPRHRLRQPQPTAGAPRNNPPMPWPKRTSAPVTNVMLTVTLPACCMAAFNAPMANVSASTLNSWCKQRHAQERGDQRDDDRQPPASAMIRNDLAGRGARDEQPNDGADHAGTRPVAAREADCQHGAVATHERQEDIVQQRDAAGVDRAGERGQQPQQEQADRSLFGNIRGRRTAHASGPAWINVWPLILSCPEALTVASTRALCAA